MTQHRLSELLTVTDAARRCGVSPATIRGWIAAGTLPVVRSEGRLRIHPADLRIAQETAHLGEVVPAWRQDRQRAGRRLRELREAAGLSQLQLAVVSGLTHEAISILETGKRAPQVATVIRLAQALGVEPDRFVGGDQPRLTMLSAAEAAARLGVPRDRLRVWLKDGTLPGTKVSGQWRVPAIAVAELGRSGRLRGRSRRLDPRYRG